MGSSFELKLRNQLSSQGVTTADVEFIMSLIRCGDLDENLKIMFCVVIKGLKSVNNLPAPSIVPPFDVRSISCSCLYQMIE